MQCEKVQEFLKTDYLDGEVNAKERQLILEHLRSCPDCAGLEQELQAQRMLIQSEKNQDVPARVWQNIRQAIAGERLNQIASTRAGIWERLKEALLVRPPVFALASSLAAIILVLVVTGVFMHKQGSLDVESMASYSISVGNEDVAYDFGTNIEKYFL